MRIRRIAALAVVAGALAVAPVLTGLVHVGALGAPVTSQDLAGGRRPMP